MYHGPCPQGGGGLVKEGRWDMYLKNNILNDSGMITNQKKWYCELPKI